MRVLQVTEASGSGTLQIVLSIATALAAEGHSVDVAYGRRPETPEDLGADLPAAVGLYRLPWESRTPGAQARAGLALRRLARDLEPDVVHLHSAFAGVVGALALPRGIPAIYTPHASPLVRPGRRRAVRAVVIACERLVARRVELVGAVSESEGALMTRAARARRVAVVPNGIPELDPGAVPGAGPRDDRPLAVAAGRIGRQRRPGECAAILASLRDVADVEWIGGAPSDEDRPLLEAGIPVTGWLGRDEALDRLGRATAYLHWSAWDGQSLALLEALARDVVIVASDIPANREVPGAAQVCRTPEAARSLLHRILTEPDVHAGLLAAQRARRGRWGAARMTGEWLRLYAALAAAPATGRTSTDGAFATVEPGPKIGLPWS